jgi:uncharacterized coiled-coil protein SlyX
LPDWFWHILTIGGAVAIAASWVLKRIPFVSRYNVLLKIGGVIALLIGIWFEGGIANEAKWQAKVAELEAKVAESEKKSKDANDALSKKQKEKIKIVRDVQVVIKERIKEVEKRIDADCKVDPEAISIINDAAKNQVRGKK